MKVTVLGCGTSSGVPRVDGDWGQCDPAEPRNRRRRVSIMVEHDGTRILVDTGPDLREQLIAEGGGRPDAVIWTHEHADHCHGIDDLRPFYFRGRQPIAGFARPRVRAALETSFAFAFFGHHGYPAYLAIDDLPEVMTIGGIRVTTVDLPHGDITSVGLRFDVDGQAAAYFTDFHELTAQARPLTTKLDLWIVDAVRRTPHPTHPHLARALGWIADAAPKRAVLTHMDQSMDYRTLMRELPPGVEPGHDNMIIEL